MLERDGRREGEGVEGKEISARSNNSTPPIEFRATWLAALGVRQEGGGRTAASERASSRDASARVRKAAWRKNDKHVRLLHSLSGGELS